MKIIIDELWNVRDSLNKNSLKEPEIKKAILDTIDNLDNGKVKVAHKIDNRWEANYWVKKAIILYLKVSQNYLIGDGSLTYFDRISLKFNGWNQMKFESAGIRISPSTSVQKGTFLSKGASLKGCFVEIGSYVGENTFIAPFTSVGSCAYIGDSVSIGSNVTIANSLEPLHTPPAVIEDNCKIDSKCDISAGIIVREGSILTTGVTINKYTKILDKETGQYFYGEIPPYSLVVAGVIPSEDGKVFLNGAVIVKRLDENMSDEEIDDILRRHK